MDRSLNQTLKFKKKVIILYEIQILLNLKI